LLFAVLAAGCTSYRIIRHRYPDARNTALFPVRTIHKAAAPFVFARAATPRTDLDTVSVRMPDARMVPFREYLESHSILAFLVIRNDTILYENYRAGHTADRLHITFSVSKSILSALIGIALGEGAIRSLDDPVTAYLPELRGKPAFEGVTVRHLIDMKSGLRFTETGNGLISDFRSDDARIYYAADLRKYLANSRRELPPGTQWDYKDSDAELLGWVLSAATKQTVSAYAEQKLWKKIGAEHDATWSLDHADGQERVSSGFNATARDLARFGRLYLNGGSWNGEQVVPAEWAARSAAVDPSRAEPEVVTWWKMQHTLYWWHAIHPKSGDFFADGSNGQRIYVDPATRTVIVQLANDSNQDFPFRKIVGYLNGTPWQYPRSIPALVSRAATTFGADSVRPVFTRLMREQAAAPERYVISEIAMNTVGGLLLKEPKTLAAAVVVFTIVTETYPRSARGYVGLSDARMAAGDRSGAVAALSKARELAPADPEVISRAKALGIDGSR
jgi:CubicO group peptidase (beta-lactamase class C family)